MVVTVYYRLPFLPLFFSLSLTREGIFLICYLYWEVHNVSILWISLLLRWSTSKSMKSNIWKSQISKTSLIPWDSISLGYQSDASCHSPCHSLLRACLSCQHWKLYSYCNKLFLLILTWLYSPACFFLYFFSLYIPLSPLNRINILTPNIRPHCWHSLGVKYMSVMFLW